MAAAEAADITGISPRRARARHPLFPRHRSSGELGGLPAPCLPPWPCLHR